MHLAQLFCQGSEQKKENTKGTKEEVPWDPFIIAEQRERKGQEREGYRERALHREGERGIERERERESERSRE